MLAQVSPRGLRQQPCVVNLPQFSTTIVAKLVSEVKDDTRLAKAERKRLQIEHAAAKTPRAKVLKLADKTSNLRSLVKSPPAEWNLERKREYLIWAKKVVQGLRGTSIWLEARFDEAAEQLERSLR
jgi:GTP diphosphokinase / guanosine-3',5'-bis(diphosphate) 3'-diphosphatase